MKELLRMGEGRVRSEREAFVVPGAARSRRRAERRGKGSSNLTGHTSTPSFSY